ncbi:hypothetical protein ACFQ2B_30620 [Streptomyces stramineus]
MVNAVGGHVGWAEFAAELIRLLGSRSELRTPAEARDPELLRRLRYRADALADELAPGRGGVADGARRDAAGVTARRLPLGGVPVSPSGD